MTQERLAPDALLEQTNLTGAIGDIDEDPDSPDGAWLTADSNNSDSAARTSFPTPSSALTAGADLQEFRALVRKFGGTGTPTARVELYEGGTLVRVGPENDVTGDLVLAFTWNASEVGDAADVECRVYGTKTGGAPAVRATVEVGAVEWNAETSAAFNHDRTQTDPAGFVDITSRQQSAARAVSDDSGIINDLVKRPCSIVRTISPN